MFRCGVFHFMATMRSRPPPSSPRLRLRPQRAADSSPPQPPPPLPASRPADLSLFRRPALIGRLSLVQREAALATMVCFGSFGAAAVWRSEKQTHEQGDWRTRLKQWMHSRPLSTRARWRLPSWAREHLSPTSIGRIENVGNDTRMRVLGPIIVANIVVLACWKFMRSPRSLAVLNRYFVHQPLVLSVPAVAMLLSTISHRELLHCAANMYMLWTFSGVGFLHAASAEQWWAAYVSTAVMSSLGSTVFAVVTGRSAASLGASGVVMALAAAVALAEPSTQFAVLFFPQWPVDAQRLLAAVVCFDVAGLVLGWRTLDHAAHLAGAAIAFCMVKLNGVTVVVRYQESCVRWWNLVRDS
eukprot:TRINITY_DN67615_c0_g1_i1.p1 TRINITY_DN67615_c0_g1~~TRINITY_DN67615_c0_g1_i1.p1  ORF type:complete len:356 (+),score=41.23 TRINITY_DN67615_c0_g1_i1:79-1146(+)